MRQAFGRNVTYANVMSTLAVVLAVGGGTAIAISLPKNSVGAKQIEKNAVGRPEVRKNAVASGEVKNNRLKGADLDESTLDEVPNAQHASLAATAGSADTAMNASNSHALDGLDAAEFLRASEAAIRGPVTVNDAPGGGSTDRVLMDAGSLTLSGACTDTGSARIAQIQATASGPGARAAVVIQDDDPETQVLAFDVALGAGPTVLLSTPSAAGTTSAELRTGSVSMLHPGATQFRTGNMMVSVNMGADCAFGLAAFG